MGPASPPFLSGPGWASEASVRPRSAGTALAPPEGERTDIYVLAREAIERRKQQGGAELNHPDGFIHHRL